MSADADSPADAADPGRTGAEVLVDCLAAGGVDHVFGIPGEHCLGIVDAVERHPDLRFVSVRHESAAAFMAEAFGKYTGRPAACLGTASVGAANLVAGVNVAQHDSTPMVTIVGQVDQATRGRGAWQEADLVALFQPLCGYSTEVTQAARLPETVNRALAHATSGRPGPVLLSVPVDIQDGPGTGQPVPPVVRRRLGPTEPDLARLVEMIRAADRPMVVAGGGIRASGARNELIGLADAVGLPVVTAFRRTDAFPNDHPGYVGALGLSTLDNVRDAVLGADLVVAVGTRLSEVSTMRYAFPRAGQRVVHIDIDDQAPAAGWLTDYWRITADARLALGTLRRACVRLGVRGPAAWWTSHPAASAIRARAGGPDPFARLTAQVAARLDAVLPDDAVVTSDAGDFFIACAALIEFRQARRYLGPTSGTMGYGLPAALAAKLATPQRSCVALCGDGGALMSIQELETAVRYQIPVIQVVFNNHAYGSIVRHQKTRYGGRSVGSRLEDLDFARLAEGLGADGYRARSVPEFDEAFGAAVKSGRPSLVEVRL